MLTPYIQWFWLNSTSNQILWPMGFLLFFHSPLCFHCHHCNSGHDAYSPSGSKDLQVHPISTSILTAAKLDWDIGHTPLKAAFSGFVNGLFICFFFHFWTLSSFIRTVCSKLEFGKLPSIKCVLPPVSVKKKFYWNIASPSLLQLSLAAFMVK